MGISVSSKGSLKDQYGEAQAGAYKDGPFKPAKQPALRKSQTDDFESAKTSGNDNGKEP